MYTLLTHEIKKNNSINIYIYCTTTVYFSRNIYFFIFVHLITYIIITITYVIGRIQQFDAELDQILYNMLLYGL